MRPQIAVFVAAGMLAAGIVEPAEAADALEQASPLDPAILNEVQSGVGVSAAAGLPEADATTGDADPRSAEANARAEDGMPAASQAAAAPGANKKAETTPPAVPRVNNAVPMAVGANEQGAAAAVGAVGSAIGGTLDFRGALQGVGTGL